MKPCPFPRDKFNIVSFTNIVGVGVRALNIPVSIGVLFPAVRAGFEGEVVAGVFVGVEIRVVFGAYGPWADLGEVVFARDVFSAGAVASGASSVGGFVY